MASTSSFCDPKTQLVSILLPPTRRSGRRKKSTIDSNNVASTSIEECIEDKKPTRKRPRKQYVRGSRAAKSTVNEVLNTDLSPFFPQVQDPEEEELANKKKKRVVRRKPRKCRNTKKPISDNTRFLYSLLTEQEKRVLAKANLACSPEETYDRITNRLSIPINPMNTLLNMEDIKVILRLFELNYGKYRYGALPDDDIFEEYGPRTVYQEEYSDYNYLDRIISDCQYDHPYGICHPVISPDSWCLPKLDDKTFYWMTDEDNYINEKIMEMENEPTIDVINGESEVGRNMLPSEVDMEQISYKDLCSPACDENPQQVLAQIFQEEGQILDEESDEGLIQMVEKIRETPGTSKMTNEELLMELKNAIRDEPVIYKVDFQHHLDEKTLDQLLETEEIPISFSIIDLQEESKPPEESQLRDNSRGNIEETPTEIIDLCDEEEIKSNSHEEDKHQTPTIIDLCDSEEEETMNTEYELVHSEWSNKSVEGEPTSENFPVQPEMIDIMVYEVEVISEEHTENELESVSVDMPLVETSRETMSPDQEIEMGQVDEQQLFSEIIQLEEENENRAINHKESSMFASEHDFILAMKYFGEIMNNTNQPRFWQQCFCDQILS